MADIYGYNRSGRAFANIISSEFAVIQGAGLNSSNSNLIQSFQANYQQVIRPIFAIGDPNLYWVAGYPQGQVDLERAVTNRGFWAGLKGQQCGIIETFSVSASGGQACATSGNSTGDVSFIGAIVESVRLRMAAGTSEIIEGGSIRVATVEAS